jgi:acyl phosphate:glycerol-3-phosphate acyltransferase
MSALPHPLAEVLAVLAAYLFGSLSFAVILVRIFRGEDVRKLGSGNAGATNVLRAAGGRLAAGTMLLDLLKGSVAVLLMRLITLDPRWLGLAAVAAVLGHIFPVFFAFKGGKGVATAVGALLVLAPLVTLLIFLVFLLVVVATRYVSLGSITAACVLPLSLQAFEAPEGTVVGGAIITCLILFSHRSNIARLLDGTERKVGKKGR